MDVRGGVDQVSVGPVTVTDRVGSPFVIRLLGEAQHPAGHHDSDAVSGELGDQRVHHFGRTSLAKKAAARRRISFSGSSSRLRFFSSRSSADSGRTPPDAVLDVGLLQPPVQAGLRDPEILGNLRDRRLAFASNLDDVPAELLREWLGHDNSSFRKASASQRMSQPIRGQTPLLVRASERSWTLQTDGPVLPVSIRVRCGVDEIAS
jgi:hypothetical protein